MKKSMVELLACPIDKHYPLELFEINVKENIDNKDVIITDGILFCNKCSRFYPIIDEIPILLPDELREKQKDINFLHKWQKKIPSKGINEGNPWHI